MQHTCTGPQYGEDGCPNSSCLGDYQCTSGDKYEQFLDCGSPCAPTCDSDVDDPVSCPGACNRGCFCIDGYVGSFWGPIVCAFFMSRRFV